MLTAHEELLQEIRLRQKTAEFNTGILTADRYVKSISECVGSDICYRYGSKGNVSFSDMMTKAAKTLTYNNDEMVVEDIYGKSYQLTDKDGDELELPKNTLMVFKHVLTTPKKDRDGDTMQTKGAQPDPKMLLLFQHTATLPIGKMLSIDEHTTKRLAVTSAIIDINELAHDCAVMVENKMGRYSHGFRAISFTKIKDKDQGNGGFDVKEFEIMEESLVSIPSNTDAETLEIIVGLAEGNKLKSPIMKEAAKTFRSKMPTKSAGGFVEDLGKLGIEVNVTLNGKAVGTGGVEEHAHTEEHDPEPKNTKCSGKTGCGCGCSGAGGAASTSKETDLSTRDEGHTEEKQMKCPKCDGSMKNGICTKCGYAVEKSAEVETETKEPPETKVAEVVIIDPVKAMTDFLAVADRPMRNKMRDLIEGINKVESLQKSEDQILTLLGKKAKKDPVVDAVGAATAATAAADSMASDDYAKHSSLHEHAAGLHTAAAALHGRGPERDHHRQMAASHTTSANQILATGRAFDLTGQIDNGKETDNGKLNRAHLQAASLHDQAASLYGEGSEIGKNHIEYAAAHRDAASELGE